MSTRPKTFLITGSTDGIGLETARQILSLGHRVIVHGRSRARVDQAMARLAAAAPGSHIDSVLGDFASLTSVRRMAQTLAQQSEPLDGIINNAGIYANEAVLTEDGFESTFGVNHIAPFLLTHMLLPALRRDDGGARIVNVSSIAHSRGRLNPGTWRSLDGFDPYGAYAQSKLANVLMTVELARRLPPGITTYALHPGVVSTKLLTEGFGMTGPDSLAAGADTSVFLATAPDASAFHGRYVVKRREGRMHPSAADPKSTADFYAQSAELAGVPALRS